MCGSFSSRFAVRNANAAAIVALRRMTGSATGPHLDYRILKNSTHVNPLVELSRMPPGVPIAADALPAFMKEFERKNG